MKRDHLTPGAGSGSTGKLETIWQNCVAGSRVAGAQQAAPTPRKKLATRPDGRETRRRVASRLFAPGSGIGKGREETDPGLPDTFTMHARAAVRKHMGAGRVADFGAAALLSGRARPSCCFLCALLRYVAVTSEKRCESRSSAHDEPSGAFAWSFRSMGLGSGHGIWHRSACSGFSVRRVSGCANICACR
jgi:hypothetical protein